MDVIPRLRDCAIVPVVALDNPDLAVPLAEALVAGGIPCVEVTFRTRHAAAAIAAIRSNLPEALVGAGTILSVDAATRALDAGAEFLVAPGTNGDVVAYAQSRRALILPGVATPTEIEANIARGIVAMKLFPAEILGGTAYLQALAGPYPDVHFVPTGGINEGNLAEYLAVCNVLACGGSWIAPANLIAAEDWSAITRNAIHAAAVVERRGHELPAVIAAVHSDA